MRARSREATKNTKNSFLTFGFVIFAIFVAKFGVIGFGQ